MSHQNFRASQSLLMNLILLFGFITLAPAGQAFSEEKSKTKKNTTSKSQENPFNFKELEQNIIRGLDFLESSQNPRGFWQNKNHKMRVLTTAWTLLAYLANGHSPRNGPYRQTVEKGLTWFIKEIRERPGNIVTRDARDWKGYYKTGAGKVLCIFVILTAIGSGTNKIQDEDLIIYCEREIKALLKKQAQNEEGARGLLQEFAAGGWGGVENSYWVTLCLLAARQINIKVPKIALENAREFWLRHYQPQYASFYDPLSGGGGAIDKDNWTKWTARILQLLALLGVDNNHVAIQGSIKVLQKCDIKDPSWFWYGNSKNSFKKYGAKIVYTPNPPPRGFWGGHSRFMGEWYLVQKLCGVKGIKLFEGKRIYSKMILRNQMESGAFRYPGWDFKWGKSANWGAKPWLRTLGFGWGWSEEMITAQAVFFLALQKDHLPVFWKGK